MLSASSVGSTIDAPFPSHCTATGRRRVRTLTLAWHQLHTFLCHYPGRCMQQVIQLQALHCSAAMLHTLHMPTKDLCVKNSPSEHHARYACLRPVQDAIRDATSMKYRCVKPGPNKYEAHFLLETPPAHLPGAALPEVAFRRLPPGVALRVHRLVAGNQCGRRHLWLLLILLAAPLQQKPSEYVTLSPCKHPSASWVRGGAAIMANSTRYTH